MPMTEWISVKDRLPDKNGKYLCCVEGYGNYRYIAAYSFALNLEEIDKYDFYNQQRCGWCGLDSEYGYYEHESVTHWMQLPELPKEE